MNYCCRSCQEVVCAVVVNRSGIDSGEVDMSIPIGKWSETTLREAIKELDFIKSHIEKNIRSIARPAAPVGAMEDERSKR